MINSYLNISLKGSQISEKLQKLGHCTYLCEGLDNNSVDDSNQIVLNNSIFASASLKSIFKSADSDSTVILLTQNSDVILSEEFFDMVDKNNSLFSYMDYEVEGVGAFPTIDYQKGSLRDNFRFGPILIFNRPKYLLELISESDYTYGGLYDLVLKINKEERPNHIAKSLYTICKTEIDNRKSGEKQFDYLDTKKRESQIEFEKIATNHLKEIGAFIDYKGLNDITFNNNQSEVEASVVIPVFNRERTIEDAVRSALNQKCDKPYNIIVVDNHSTDNTTKILQEIAKTDKKLIHIIPEETDLKIGGCWNKALNAKECGKFAIQLDSDDIYKDENTIQKVVNKFYEEKCAMVIGSYKITNFKLETLPPGTIDHKEWTAENGMNNALRINGLGAPRAFYTPLARQILFPNCSYGEDYAMGLAISRQFKIGRIYDILYICRRWEGNSDADLSLAKQNQNDFAKDAIRTLEIEKRILLNRI